MSQVHPFYRKAVDRAKLGVPKLSEAHNFFYVVDRTNMKIDMQKNKNKIKTRQFQTVQPDGLRYPNGCTDLSFVNCNNLKFYGLKFP